MHASHVIVMKNGGIIAFGPPREVLNEKILSEVYNINVMLRTVSYKDGEAVISLPGGID
jgi:ABC-type cobalamin/Fe3+-siderophores transport system ATPase subunit